MSVGPRIVFVRFVTSDSPKLVPWLSHATRVLGADTGVQHPVPATGVVVWQLVSANNRELARGFGAHESFEAARAHAAMVVSEPDLELEQVSEPGRGVYGWFAAIGGVPVVTCARWYLTARDRRHSIDLAVRSIPVATLHAGARLTNPALLAGDRA